ncbi:MAG TPA: class I SAM-dependent methyltransferase, partial [Pyrinomonadaceae bacterium]|nr:class I SAM-dependent methyltransferase [Pyrinomonadaceae bacterium]
AEGAIAPAAVRLIRAARRLGASPSATRLRAGCVVRVFESMERVFASGADPISALNAEFDELAHSLDQADDVVRSESNRKVGKEGVASESAPAHVRTITGKHYGKLFAGFSDGSFWEEPLRLLSVRLERNGIALRELQGRNVLDAGCGGGRYTVAWRMLTAASAIGLDASEIGIADARRRVDAQNLKGVQFEQGNVLDLPFRSESFDVVFSNGVLHHTTDWRRGVRELVRTLKPAGLGWLYLIENPGGLFWDVIEMLRVIMTDESRGEARSVLNSLGVPANRIFYMLDHVMVPINIRLSTREIEECLKEAGAIEVRRLERGADFDRVERLYQRDPYAEIKYGVGENRYVFSK